MFQKVDAYAGDPILSLMERFKEDSRSDKVNLSIGLYYNEDGIIPQLKAVAEAEARLNAKPHGASLYLPMEGLNTYRHTIAPLLFGADHPVLQQQRVATIQTLGGSGALKVGADFLKRYFPDSGVWVSDPTWENHIAIFEGAGFEVSTYPWYDDTTNGVRFNDLLATLNTLPARSIVLLHPCCHNPTGADLTPAQWDGVIEILKARDLIPFLDIAYQGLLVTALVMVSYFIGHFMETGEWTITNSAHGTTMAFVTMSMAEIFHSMNMRSQRGSIFKLGSKNWLLLGAAVVSLLATTAVCEIPLLAGAFGFTSVEPAEYLVALLLSVLVVPIVELVKWIQRRSAKHED